MFFLSPFLFSVNSNFSSFLHPHYCEDFGVLFLGVWLGCMRKQHGGKRTWVSWICRETHGFLSLHNSMMTYFNINSQQSRPVGMDHSECALHFHAWIIYSSSPQLLWLVTWSREGPFGITASSFSFSFPLPSPSLLFSVYWFSVYVGVGAEGHAWRPEHKVQGSVLAFHNAGHGNFCGKFFYPLSHLKFSLIPLLFPRCIRGCIYTWQNSEKEKRFHVPIACCLSIVYK